MKPFVMAFALAFVLCTSASAGEIPSVDITGEIPSVDMTGEIPSVDVAGEIPSGGSAQQLSDDALMSVLLTIFSTFAG